MRASEVRNWMPGTEKFERLSVFQKVDVLNDILAHSRASKSRDPYLESELVTEEGYWRRRATLADPFWDVTHNIRVADEEGREVPYFPRAAQLALHDLVNANTAAEIPSWFLLPKPRKIGFSTAVANIIHVRTFRAANRKALVMAQKGPEGERIFSKYRFVAKHDLLSPKLSGDSVVKIEAKYSNSLIELRSAEEGRQQKPGSGRGETYHDFHGSEVAFWADSAVKLMMGILNAMPRFPVWNTARFLESTGYGRGGYFYEKCMEAMESPGQTPWKIVFFPWIDLHDCYIPLEPGEKERMLDEILGSSKGDPEEIVYLQKHKLSLEQIKFRRAKIIEQEGKTYKEKVKSFRQEYPFTLDDAFQDFGNSTFDQDSLTLIGRVVGPPRWKGDLISQQPLWVKNRRGHQHPVTPMPMFTGTKKRDESGKLEVWAQPRDRHRYILAVDPSHGKVSGDPATITVLDRDTQKQVAVWEDWVDVEDLVEPTRLLSKWYNNAIIMVEVNLGRLLIKWLSTTDRRPFLYRSRSDEKMVNRGSEPEDMWGFNMSRQTKPIVVGVLREAVSNTPELFSDPKTVRQLMDFRQEFNPRTNELKYTGATGTGRHDDRAISLGMCLVGHVLIPLNGMPPPQEHAHKPKAAERWDMRRTKPKKREYRKHPEMGVL